MKETISQSYANYTRPHSAPCSMYPNHCSFRLWRHDSRSSCDDASSSCSRSTRARSELALSAGVSCRDYTFARNIADLGSSEIGVMGAEPLHVPSESECASPVNINGRSIKISRSTNLTERAGNRTSPSSTFTSMIIDYTYPGCATCVALTLTDRLTAVCGATRLLHRPCPAVETAICYS